MNAGPTGVHQVPPLSCLVADMRHMTAAWDAPPWRIVLGALLRTPFQPAIGAIILFRLGQAAYPRRVTRPVAQWCKARAIRTAGAELHPAAQVGPGFALVHSVGIVIGHEVRAGRDLVVYQGVTIGHGGGAQGQPTLGDGVRVGAGAKVLGPVHVGDGARIGANAVVLADVPSGQTVVGVWKGRAE